MGGMDTEDTFRLIANLIRRGTVIAVDLVATPPCVRVASGALDSDWMPWISLRAGASTTWDAPTVGEQGLMFSPGGEPEQGIFLGGIFSTEIRPPSNSADETVRQFPDGARISYDHAAGHLLATGIKTCHVEASERITLKAPDILLDGRATVTDLLSYQAGMSGKNGKGNGTAITGDIIHRDGELSSNGVVLDRHDHSGVQRGGSNTDGPNKP